MFEQAVEKDQTEGTSVKNIKEKERKPSSEKKNDVAKGQQPESRTTQTKSHAIDSKHIQNKVPGSGNIPYNSPSITHNGDTSRQLNTKQQVKSKFMADE